MLIGVISLHVGALFAPWTFSWTAFWIFLVLLWLTNGVGVCLGYHRLLTHRSFKCAKPLEYLFTILGSLTSQGGAISWVSTHRYHHKFSDLEGDPHTPTQGFLWSHMLWFLYRSPVLEGKDFYEKWVPELTRDPFHRFIGKYGWINQWILGMVLLAWGGLSYVVWGIFLRTVVALHLTWAVNSATHKWGYRTFKTTDDSRNLWWVALLTNGEGWHNNHHAFQYSAAHGLFWWEFDVTYLTIRILSAFKLANAVLIPNKAQIQQSRIVHNK